MEMRRQELADLSAKEIELFNMNWDIMFCRIDLHEAGMFNSFIGQIKKGLYININPSLYYMRALFTGHSYTLFKELQRYNVEDAQLADDELWKKEDIWTS